MEHFHSRKCISKCRLRNDGHFCNTPDLPRSCTKPPMSCNILCIFMPTEIHTGHRLYPTIDEFPVDSLQEAMRRRHIAWGYLPSILNTLRLRQNGSHFADNIFKCIFLNENVWIPIKIALKFVPKGPIHNITALFQIMSRRWPGDKLLSEAMMVSLLTHICVTRPQWVKSLWLWVAIWPMAPLFHVSVLNYSMFNQGPVMLRHFFKSRVVKMDFLTWTLIGWLLWYFPTRTQIWKFLLTNTYFTTKPIKEKVHD